MIVVGYTLLLHIKKVFVHTIYNKLLSFVKENLYKLIITNTLKKNVMLIRLSLVFFASSSLLDSSGLERFL